MDNESYKTRSNRTDVKQKTEINFLLSPNNTLMI